MLSLQMKSGDYVTIGDRVVVQVFKESGPQFRISIKAPKEVSIVRGKVLERDGEQRPEGLLDRKPKRSPSDKQHYAQYLQKVKKRQETYRSGQEICAGILYQLGEILDNPEHKLRRRELELVRTQMRELSGIWESLNEGIMNAGSTNGGVAAGRIAGGESADGKAAGGGKDSKSADGKAAGGGKDSKSA